MNATFERWEVWKADSNNSISSFASSNVAARAQLEKDAVLLFTIEATSYAQAMAIINEKLGLGPYKPTTEI